ncbi:HAD-IIB family hydrolase [Agriterribacter sp.]|uniref:HAD-IIB family hydrolase n=1 Tax=Agriterribacter sp. TaxID=2821509 RepID=UPI002C4D3859|nr:HAD-IIB family hydrolase [Agriterribacter sp.]HRO44462.1 HAD-IIB family hydrolase [Agriterribacter sp.]HRQ16512.1 HAD-IIB family hydrolase [Agriterribacter sp.]
MLLATDLDGTFLGGAPAQRAALYRIINSHKALQLVFVSGRGLATILPLFEEPLMPKPDFIICDVGATIVSGNSLEPVEPIQSLIEERWPGKKQVAELLSGVKGLVAQNVPQQRRCSYFYDVHTDVDDLKDKVEQLNCDLVLSAGKFADVLPKGINKGYSLQLLAKQYHFTIENILVAGDTFNDLSLFKTGYKGVVVGNAEPGLMEATAGFPAIYHAKEEGAGGILEAMQHFSLFKKLVI